MGDPSIEVTEENQDAAQLLKSKAIDAISEGSFFSWLFIKSPFFSFFLFLWEIVSWFIFLSGNLTEAIDNLTEAILLNPNSAILYATRGTYWVCFSFLFIFMYFGVCLQTNITIAASVFVKLNKPNAAIRDANAALKVCL